MNERVAALATSGEIDPALVGGGGVGKYIPFGDLPPALRTWDFTNWGTYVPADAATEAPARARLSTDSGWADGLHDGSHSVTMNLWHGVNGSVFRLYENGELVATRSLDADTPNAQTATVELNGRVDGTYVYTGVVANGAGATETGSVTVRVTDAAPGKIVLSHDNRDRDGYFALTTDLRWGTNATGYRLYENGEVIDEQQLTASTPQAQRAVTTVTDRAPGRYEYVAVFINGAGETSSRPVTVTVR
jgi:hypothetical protein